MKNDKITISDAMKSSQFPPIEQLKSALSDCKIEVTDVKAFEGPAVTLYKVSVAAGVKVSKIRRYQDDIEQAMNTQNVRIVTLPDSIGIEIPNERPVKVPLKSMLDSDAFRNSNAVLPVVIGCTTMREVKVFDLAEAPHLLVAGASVQDKSMGLEVIVTSLLYAKRPSELKFVFIDPKTAEKELHSLNDEMERRYELLLAAGVNNISSYNEKCKGHRSDSDEDCGFLPYIVVIIDEYADLITNGDKNAAKNIYSSIIRLAQKGKSIGIHMVIATQRPSRNIITGLIKANFPTRLAFGVSTKEESLTIIDSPGAEKLIGNGDLLYLSGADIERLQCATIDEDEKKSVTKLVGERIGEGKTGDEPTILPPYCRKNGR